MPKPIRPNQKLLTMWRQLTPDQRKRFAKLAQTTAGSLRQTVEGRRGISSDLAVRIEKSAQRMQLTPIGRGELNPTCHACEYRRACAKVELG